MPPSPDAHWLALRRIRGVGPRIARLLLENFGTPQAVADEVKRRLDELAPGGGYVFSPIHNIQAGVPVENIQALFRAAREYGVYRS